MSLRSSKPNRPGRRDFLKTTGLVAAAAGVGLSIARGAHAAGSDVLKLGLVGCGGRGTGAAMNALAADPHSKIVAIGDAFEDRMTSCLKKLQSAGKDRVDIDPSRCFAGFDAYQRVIESDVDVVLLCEVPHFRPKHLKAAIDANKHVFCEKPVAVDGPGVRSILQTCEQAAKKNLNVVSGLCWRYHQGVQETMKRVHDGAIGDVVSMIETYLTGLLWHRGHEPDWTEMQYQMRNWYYFTWLSGDHNVEQHIHSLDKALWAMHDEPPAKAWGLGGRQVRTEAKFGDIYDHHAVVYEWANGVRAYAYTRQQAGCYNDVSDLYLGTKGRANILKHEIEGASPWKYEGPKTNMYEAEHKALFSAIRAGKPINNGKYMAYSTMLAILGRMVNYTGKQITWDEAMNSKQDLSPASYAWDAKPPVLPGADGHYPVAMPGVTKFV